VSETNVTAVRLTSLAKTGICDWCDFARAPRQLQYISALRFSLFLSLKNNHILIRNSDTENKNIHSKISQEATPKIKPQS
jgi:hypothetical protein